MNDMSSLPDYYQLLREAQTTAQAVDDYDVDSSDPDDFAIFKQLVAESDVAQLALIRYIGAHAFTLVNEIEHPK